MSTVSPQYLDAHVPPEPLVVPNFWSSWEQSCRHHFPGCDEDIVMLGQLHDEWKKGALFMHLHDGLEHLLLANRSNAPLPLTSKHWLALIWLMLAGYDGTHAQHATTLALDKARALYKDTQGAPVQGISVDEWIDRGPWLGNANLWTLLFKSNLALVHPSHDPLCWALRKRWMAWEQEDASLSQEMRSQHSPPDLSSWALPRPMALESLENVLRCGKRWTKRMGLTLSDASCACAASPQWSGVYLFAMWLVQHDAGTAPSPGEAAMLRQYLVPNDVAYWLMLTHDNRHHKSEYRNTVAMWELDNDPHYRAASNLLTGLQSLSPHTPTQLALAAWAQWHCPDVEFVPLPDFS